MSDWNVGDLVECVADDDCPFHVNEPEDAPEMIGKVFRIKSLGSPWFDGCIGQVTFTSDPPGDEGWCRGCFRKIDRADEQFTARIKACRPAHRKVSV